MIKKTKGEVRVLEQLCSRTRNVHQNRRFRHTPICKELTLKVAWEVENSKSRRVIYRRRQYECSGSIWALCGARGHEKVRPEQLNFHQYSSCACCFDAAILILCSLVNPVELFWNFFWGLICLLMIGKMLDASYFRVQQFPRYVSDITILCRLFQSLRIRLFGCFLQGGIWKGHEGYECCNVYRAARGSHYWQCHSHVWPPRSSHPLAFRDGFFPLAVWNLFVKRPFACVTSMPSCSLVFCDGYFPLAIRSGG